MRGIVIISCGAAKLPHAAPAGELYRGAYFKKLKAAALALAPSGGWLILSAKHGLVRPGQVLEPYEMHIRTPGSVSVDRLRQQVRRMALEDSPVTVLAGKAYVDMVRQIWPFATAPLQTLPRRGMGHQMQYLTVVAERGAL